MYSSTPSPAHHRPPPPPPNKKKKKKKKKKKNNFHTTSGDTEYNFSRKSFQPKHNATFIASLQNSALLAGHDL